MSTFTDKRSVVIVKARAGNMSAQLIRSIFKPRAGRKLLVSIGSVAHGANPATGVGVTMKKPFTLADLDDVDRAKVADWLQRSGKQNAAAKPTVATLEAKLDRLLALAGGSMVPSPSQSVAGAAAATVGGDALTKLEQAVDAAGTYITAQLDELAAAGVELSNKSHTKLEPHNANNRLDVLQARANALRFDVLPRFQRACQASGLMKSAKVARD